MRNRYLDILRAAAIVLVIVQHLAGWPRTVALPALGVLFAIAGSLTAGSLGEHGARRAIVSRLRRLLPPLWLLGLVTVPVMLVAGWQNEDGGEHPFHVAGLAYWILPVGTPPGSDAGLAVWEPLWFLRAYIWLLLLSPLLHALYRRAGWFLIAVAVAAPVVLDVTGPRLPGLAADLPGLAADLPGLAADLVAFGGCWLAGFAHRDGRLARLKPWLAWPLAVLLGAAAVVLSPALLPIAVVPLLLYRHLPVARVRPLDATVILLNARALTLYLWSNVAFAAAGPELALEGGRAADLASGLALTVLAVLIFGWAEDMSAGRSPRFWPTGADALRREDPIVPPPAPALTAPALTGPALTAARNGRVDARAYSAAAAMNRMPTPWRPPAPRAAAEPFSGRHVATDPITGEVLPPHPFPSPRQRDGDGTA